MNIRKRIFEIIEKSQGNDIASSIFDVFIIALILLNISAVIAASFSDFAGAHAVGLHRFEVFSIGIFTIEYILRMWTARNKYPEVKYPYLKYIFSASAIIDLLAILPFFLPFLIPVDLRFLRVIRLLRIVRIFKLSRYNKAMDLMIRVLKNEREKIVMTIFMTAIMLILSASVMYHIENAVQPEQFSNIPETIWWAVATLTTVGYGDVYPVTVAGKILGGIIAILGIGLVALPAGIISSGFVGAISNKKTVCPHCGKEIE
ncbi:MAG: ion transporter [Treponema sp.]|jgi:voltage-gated potassium channel|nr:ion transporter [Treponema sp.]